MATAVHPIRIVCVDEMSREMPRIHREVVLLSGRRAGKRLAAATWAVCRWLCPTTEEAP